MKKIPIAKPYVTKDEAQAAYNTILTGWITQGPRVQEFEEKFATYTGAKHAVAVSNCTTALHLAMIVAGVSEGDEVICPSMSYVATANCIRYVGAKPVFAEIDPNNYNISLEHTKRLITDKTKAILIVHQIGMPVNIAAFQELGKEKGLKIIEDAACAAGSAYQNSKIGSHSELVCFSFHPRKVISTGDGGMITTSNPDYARRLKLLRQHGMAVNDQVRHNSKKVIITDHLEVGFNYRMTDIQASVGIKQLEKLDWIVDQRRLLAMRYHKELGDINTIQLPIESEGYYSNYQSYSVLLKDSCQHDRNDLMERMLEQGIATRSGIMTSHRETAYKNYVKNLALPVSEKACDRSILLPLYVPMEEEDQTRVIQTFKRLVES